MGLGRLWQVSEGIEVPQLHPMSPASETPAVWREAIRSVDQFVIPSGRDREGSDTETALTDVETTKLIAVGFADALKTFQPEQKSGPAVSPTSRRTRLTPSSPGGVDFEPRQSVTRPRRASLALTVALGVLIGFLIGFAYVVSRVVE